MLRRLMSLPRVVQLFLVADILVGLAYVGNWIIGRPFEKITSLVNMNGEANLPAWYSSMQWVVCGALMAFSARRQQQRGARTVVPLVLLAVILVALSLDEIAQLHENFSIGVSGKVGSGQGPLRSLWLPALGVPFLFVVGLIVRRGIQAFDEVPGSLRWFIIGFGVFALGAFAIEPIHEVVLRLPDSPIEVWFEETMEMLGATIVLYSCYLISLHEREIIDSRPGGPRTLG